MSGLDLQEELHENGIVIPIIVVTGHGDVPTAVRAIKAGAVEFIEKPVNDQLLLRHHPALYREGHRISAGIGDTQRNRGALYVAHAARARGDGTRSSPVSRTR